MKTTISDEYRVLIGQFKNLRKDLPKNRIGTLGSTLRQRHVLAKIVLSRNRSNESFRRLASLEATIEDGLGKYPVEVYMKLTHILDKLSMLS
jgi:hypothetical protein